MGLVFGYGEVNAKKFENEEKECGNFVGQRVEHTSLEEIKNLFKDNVSIEDLCLPSFVSYQEEDKVIKDYKEKRKLIVQYIKKKKLTNEVFKILEEGVDLSS